MVCSVSPGSVCFSSLWTIVCSFELKFGVFDVAAAAVRVFHESFDPERSCDHHPLSLSRIKSRSTPFSFMTQVLWKRTGVAGMKPWNGSVAISASCCLYRCGGGGPA